MVEYKTESNELAFWERILPYAIEIYAADFDPEIEEDPMTWYAYIYTRDGYCLHDTNKPYELKSTQIHKIVYLGCATEKIEDHIAVYLYTDKDNPMSGWWSDYQKRLFTLFDMLENELSMSKI